MSGAADDPTDRAAAAADRTTWMARAAVLVLLVVPAFAVPWLQLGKAKDAVAFAVAVLGVNLVVGYAGQISLGHGAFVGLGAYTTVVLSADHGWPLLLAVPGAAAVGFVVGLLVGVPALRIRGLYLALMTLGVGAAFGPIVKRMDSITNGTNGKGTQARVEAPAWFGETRAADARWNYLVIAAIAGIVYLVAHNVVRGRVGRALAGMRDNDLSAATFGVPVARYKIAMFGLSAAVAAVAGALFMLEQPFAIESTYTQTLSIQLYTAVFIGGVGTIAGSIAGGAVIVLIPLLLDRLGLTLDQSLLYGAALVVLTLFAPDGLIGGLQAAGRRFRRGAQRRREP